MRRHAINAYGTIDQVISPPLLSSARRARDDAADGENPADALAGTELSGVLNGDLLSILQPAPARGCRASAKRATPNSATQAQADPATAAVVDGLAPSIAFPTIIRNRTNGQGVPLGFIVAVNNEYDEQFGLTTIDGRPVQMEELRTGVGNIFAAAGNLFRWAGSSGIDVDSVAALRGPGRRADHAGPGRRTAAPLTGTLDCRRSARHPHAGNPDHGRAMPVRT